MFCNSSLADFVLADLVTSYGYRGHQDQTEGPGIGTLKRKYGLKVRIPGPSVGLGIRTFPLFVPIPGPPKIWPKGPGIRTFASTDTEVDLGIRSTDTGTPVYIVSS